MLSTELGVSRETINEWWTVCEREIAASPNNYGWEVDGDIMAPANADPLVSARATCNKLLKKLQVHPETLSTERTRILKEKVPGSQAERDFLLEKLFQGSYPKMETHFHPDAVQFINAIRKYTKNECAIITNSRTDKVQGKLAKLRGLPTLPRVVGNAHKMKKDSRWTMYWAAMEEGDTGVGKEIPSQIRIPGLERPIFLQRRLYFESMVAAGIIPPDGFLQVGTGTNAIDHFREATMVAPHKTVVIGDVWELDHSMPGQVLGMKTAYKKRPDSPRHEVDFVKEMAKQGKAVIGDTLMEIFGKIEEMMK